jgi:hypothetical protein
MLDLRTAWLPTLPRAADTAGEGGDGDPAAPDPPAPADNTTDDGGPELSAEEIANPRIKELSDENARHRHVAKAEKERADAAEATVGELTEALHTARMEAAFVRAGFGILDDLDAAWKLADKAGVTITDDGTVTGMEEVVTKLLDRYPYLHVPDPEPWQPPPTEPSGRRTSGRRTTGEATNRSVLETKFPALRHRR